MPIPWGTVTNNFLVPVARIQTQSPQRPNAPRAVAPAYETGVVSPGQGG